MTADRGYDVFGIPYGRMLRQDLHAVQSIDHLLMQQMVRLDENSRERLYREAGHLPARIKEHELYPFARRFEKSSQQESIDSLLRMTRQMAEQFDTPFEQMQFGGTEQEILLRGTDWCSDLSRLGAVLLMCLHIPARLLYLANRNKAYHGHVAVEAFYNGGWGVVDFLYGLRFCFQDAPLSAWQLMTTPQMMTDFLSDQDREYYMGLYDAAAISEYDPMNRENDYSISKPNQYYLTLMTHNLGDGWIMGEEDSAEYEINQAAQPSGQSRD